MNVYSRLSQTLCRWWYVFFNSTCVNAWIIYLKMYEMKWYFLCFWNPYQCDVFVTELCSPGSICIIVLTQFLFCSQRCYKILTSVFSVIAADVGWHSLIDLMVSDGLRLIEYTAILCIHGWRNKKFRKRGTIIFLHEPKRNCCVSYIMLVYWGSGMAVSFSVIQKSNYAHNAHVCLHEQNAKIHYLKESTDAPTQCR